MRIKITNSKNSIHYSIIQDIVKNGKRTTKVYENIGNLNSLKQRAGTEDPIIWLQNYVDNLNNKTKNKSLPIIIEKYENRIIEKDIQNSFNIGYLFLKNIYYSLKLDKICEKIKLIAHNYCNFYLFCKKNSLQWTFFAKLFLSLQRGRKSATDII